MNILSKKYSLKFIFCALAFGYILWTYQYLAIVVVQKASENKNYSRRLPNSTDKTILNSVIQKPPCSPPSRLVGKLAINFDSMIEYYHQRNEIFGKKSMSSLVFEPATCSPRLSIAIIIPFRNRQKHLEYLLGHLHPILERQLNRYQIFVVEQSGNFTFNKGRVMNSGFNFVKNQYGVKFDCYIFHDVDMLPEYDKNIYRCNPASNQVRHLSCSVNKFDYKALCCGMTVGGVLAFTEEQYMKVNGFPNNYWGWGGEDDDMNTRIKLKGLKVVRPRLSECRYYMVEHKRDKLNSYVEDKVNWRVAEAPKHIDENGLSNLNTTVLSVKRFPQFVHVYVDVGLPGT